MSDYELMGGTRSGFRVADAATGETVVHFGRLLDNVSEASAREILDLLRRRDALRMEHLMAANARNDLATILERMQASG
jgi:hypothetical protein